RLERQGVKRRVKYAVPNLVSVAAVAAASDLIGVLPLRVARGFQRTYDIALHPFPFELPPMPIYMVWHESFDSDEGHQWLRGVLRELAAAL
ncbi:MAG: LysR substrate-binding domain-containing protein, partial [Hyphomicrobium sp.]